jgi:transposase-like protein
MICEKCGGDFCKNGVNAGIQRYKCKDCGIILQKEDIQSQST